MAVPAAILALVGRFDEQRDAYQSGRYNETQLRREFLDPFFKALGWDVDNEQGYAEAYKDVIHEDSIKVEGASKAPDYCFRIGGMRKFFVEAKAPSVRIREDIHPAFQLRRYAWSAKLPLSILTDFEEFAVYDCRVKPDKADKASVARTLYLRYTEYAERWDELASIFARESVLKGSFDRYAESTRAKRGTAEVDAAFLKDLEGWREALARNIALRNPALGVRELNFAVQQTIDRIIFLRICEARDIEEYGRLLALTNGQHVYDRLFLLFRQADARYNSGLFHFEPEKGRPEAPDELTSGLVIDDKLLKEIIRKLYYPDSPYEFAVLPADILGQVYEQFLGKVIRLTPGHRAVVEDKPEVKKAGGVYYTPTYIVDYIVAHTVGKLLEGKTPKEAARLRALDAACGSGSFLIGAYQCLLDWHRDRYLADGPAKHRKELYQAAGGEWRLTTAERKRILLNSIYGVDIDPQAVEVTKLSLLLKVLEGETEETLGSQLRLFRERALPDLARNIKCGNSLIGPDFYDDRQLSFLDEDEIRRINAFDWQAEFPEVMREGGFDAVVGNPPYSKVSGRTDRMYYSYFNQRYKCAGFKTELYALFAERAIDLLGQRGMHGFVVPNSFLAGIYLKSLRTLLAEQNYLCEIVLLKDVPVFRNAKLDSVIYVVRRGRPSPDDCIVLRVADAAISSRPQQTHSVTVADWMESAGREFRVIQGRLPVAVIGRMRGQSRMLYEIATVNLGLVLESNSLLADLPSDEHPDPIVLGRDIVRYGPVTVRRWFCYARDPIVGGTKRHSVYATGPRIVVQAIRNLKLPRRLVCALVPAGTFTMGTVHNIIVRDTLPDVMYLLGVLNSKLMNEFYASHYPEHRIKGTYLKELPIVAVDNADAGGRRRHDQLVALVERMLELHKRLGEVKTAHDKDLLRRQIEATDRQIDRLVYELYELTDEEIAIVEGQER